MSTIKTTFFRAFPALLEQTGPEKLTGLLVPYDVPTQVLDDLPEGPDIYFEGFRQGAFARQSGTREKGILNKIGLVHTHESRGLGYLGPFVGLREAPDGLYGDVRVMPSKVEDVVALLESGVDELSVEFRLHRQGHTTVDGEGVRWRTSAHLDQVALEPKGAYRTAQVLAFRAEADEVQKAEAEAKAAEEAEAAEAAAAAAAVEAEAAEREERRARFAALEARLPDEEAKQQEYIRQFGITKPEGFRRA